MTGPPKEVEGRAPQGQPSTSRSGSRDATQTDINDTGRGRQMPPVGPHPDVAVLLVGALLWSTPADAAAVLALVRDDDLADPALAAVLGAVRTLSASGCTLGPQLVLDELRRTGKLRGHVPDRLREATTSGASPTAARDYAAAVVADGLRRRIESAGAALSAAATTAAEPELAPLVAQAAVTVSSCAHRLAVLRRETT